MGGCSAPPSRASWVQQELVEDNWTIYRREPAALAAKYRKMQASFYAYFRGTVRLYLRDLTRSHALAMPTRFGSAASSYVACVVDPHPENIGTYRNVKGELRVDFNDFDGATYAPYYFDVRRLTVGFATQARLFKLQENQPMVYEKLLREVSRGYVKEIQNGAKSRPFQIRPKQGFGVLLDDLLKRAQKQGQELRKLNEYTRVEGGKRSMFYGVLEAPEVKDVIRDELRKPTEDERQLLFQVIRDYRRTRVQKTSKSELQIKGISRRFGAGVGSYPRLRFYVLVEGATPSLKDDGLLEVKELTDVPEIPGFPRFPKHRFSSNAERVVWFQRQLQEDETNDVHLGWATSGVMSFRIRHRTAYQKNYSTGRFLEKYASGQWKPQDLLVFAFQAGRLLARAHGNAKTLSGSLGRQAIWDAMEGRTSEFIDETARFAQRYTEQQWVDFGSFSKALERDSWLGASFPTLRWY